MVKVLTINYTLLIILVIGCKGKQNKIKIEKKYQDTFINKTNNVSSESDYKLSDNEIFLNTCCKDSIDNNLHLKLEYLDSVIIKNYPKTKKNKWQDHFLYIDDYYTVFNKNKTQFITLCNTKDTPVIIGNYDFSKKYGYFKNPIVFAVSKFFISSNKKFFKTKKGVQIGIKEKDFLQIYNKCKFFLKRKNNNYTYYIIDAIDDEYSKLYNYNQLYFSKYVFYKGKLMEMSFGYHIP